MREDSINAEIEEFSEEWQEIFEKMAGENRTGDPDDAGWRYRDPWS